MANLSVSVNGIRFPNPVLTAAGPNVRTADLMLQAAAGGAGGIVSKTVSVHAARDPRPTIRGTVCRGLMNCETWSEMPVEEYLQECRKVKDAGVPLILSVGYKPDEVSRLGKLFEAEVGPAAIEFSTHYTGRSLEPLIEVAQALRSSVSVPIWMKISPNFPDIEKLALAVSPIVDGFVAINSYGPVLDFDVESGAPLLGSDQGQGWMSGPAILPIGLRIVHQLTSIQDRPVIGVGGIEKGVDAVKFFMAGASAVQICSAAIRNGHTAYGKVAREIAEWLDRHSYSSVREIQGLYGKRLLERRSYGETPVMSVDPEKCTGCEACQPRCVQGALYMDDRVARVRPASCIGCGFCQDYCAYDAMELK
jgi:dihydroorotate dehydrogenase (NAD+) catalytic subunit